MSSQRLQLTFFEIVSNGAEKMLILAFEVIVQIPVYSHHIYFSTIFPFLEHFLDTCHIKSQHLNFPIAFFYSIFIFQLMYVLEFFIWYQIEIRFHKILGTKRISAYQILFIFFIFKNSCIFGKFYIVILLHNWLLRIYYLFI